MSAAQVSLADRRKIALREGPAGSSAYNSAMRRFQGVRGKALGKIAIKNLHKIGQKSLIPALQKSAAGKKQARKYRPRGSKAAAAAAFLALEEAFFNTAGESETDMMGDAMTAWGLAWGYGPKKNQIKAVEGSYSPGDENELPHEDPLQIVITYDMISIPALISDYRGSDPRGESQAAQAASLARYNGDPSVAIGEEEEIRVIESVISYVPAYYLDTGDAGVFISLIVSLRETDQKRKQK